MGMSMSMSERVHECVRMQTARSWAATDQSRGSGAYVTLLGEVSTWSIRASSPVA